MHRIRILMLLIGMTKIATAQPHGLSLWFVGQLPVNFSEKWQWTNDFTYRSNGMKTEAYQRFYRTGIRFQPSEKWNAAAGVAFFSTLGNINKDEDGFGKEFRLWHEIVYQADVTKKVSFQERLRFEERFVDEVGTNPANFILNVNNRISLMRPVSRKWDVQVSDEFFEQMIDKHWRYNQNRLLGAGIFNVSKGMQLQGAYIWILRRTFSQHAIQFTIRKMFLTYGRHDHSGE